MLDGRHLLEVELKSKQMKKKLESANTIGFSLRNSSIEKRSSQLKNTLTISDSSSAIRQATLCQNGSSSGDSPTSPNSEQLGTRNPCHAARTALTCSIGKPTC